MPAETEIVNDVPADARPVNGNRAGATVSLMPVRFSIAELWQSPCTWILVGVVGTLVALHFINKRR